MTDCYYMYRCTQQILTNTWYVAYYVHTDTSANNWLILQLYPTESACNSQLHTCRPIPDCIVANRPRKCAKLVNASRPCDAVSQGRGVIIVLIILHAFWGSWQQCCRPVYVIVVWLYLLLYIWDLTTVQLQMVGTRHKWNDLVGGQTPGVAWKL